jgi:hypothetical protein
MRLPIRSVPLVCVLAVSLWGCTINLVRNPKEPQILSQQIGYFKWLYEKGFYRSDPELMRSALIRVFDIKRQTAEGEEPAREDRLERLLLELERQLVRKPADPARGPQY